MENNNKQIKDIENNFTKNISKEIVDNNKNSNLKQNKKEFILKMFVSESESLFIKSCLKNLNNNFNKLDNKNKNKLQKEKSMSEFLREIILNNLIDVNKNIDDNLINKIEQIEKYVKRNLSLNFKSLEQQFGKDEAKRILNNVKDEENK